MLRNLKTMDNLSRVERRTLSFTNLQYESDKVLWRNLVRFRRTLIPRYFFYFLFLTLGTILELTLFRPPIVTREYLIAVMFTIAAAIAFGIETYFYWRSI